MYGMKWKANGKSVNCSLETFNEEWTITCNISEQKLYQNVHVPKTMTKEWIKKHQQHKLVRRDPKEMRNNNKIEWMWEQCV